MITTGCGEVATFLEMVLHYTTYAVGSKPGVCLDNRPDLPPAGRNGTFFFRKMWHVVPHFPEKDQTYHAAAGEIHCYREQTAHLNATA
jgi:hypothetical protein